MAPCPICGSPAAPAFDARYMSVAKCGSGACGHLFVADPAPAAGVQSPSDPDAEAALFAARNRELVASLARQRIVGNELRTLDFGTGVGHIVDSVRTQLPSASITCIEADEAMSARLRSKGLTVCERIADVPDGSMDALIAIEVLEHLDDPVAVLSELGTKLKPHGRAYVTTPLGERRNGSHATNAYDTPEHIQFFTERSIALTLRKAGFANFTSVVANELYGVGDGLTDRVKGRLKRLARPVWARLFGPRHLVFVAERSAG